MQKLMRRRRRIAVGGVLSGALCAAMAFSGTAQAATTPAKNNVILGSGSSTTYNMMQSLDTLFNDSLGCYMTQPGGTTQTLDFSCASVNGGNQVGQGYTENPRNDVAAEEPALGSSAGIEQLELGGGPGTDSGSPETAVVNYARSSRALKSTDQPGLNFVSYATDGVSWLTFPEVNGKATASSVVKNLTIGDLTNIWDGHYKTWNSIPGYKTTAGNANICVYVAQLSSGTESTWASALITGGTPAELNEYVTSLATAPKGCAGGSHYGTTHTIFENEAQDIVKNGDEANAIFFFSYGKYQVVCTKRTAQCDNGLSVTGKKKTVVRLGDIDGVAPSVKTILCSPCSAAFPVTRDLFNVYSNGSNTNASTGFPAATPATINYVSEIGFLCKTQLNKSGGRVVDPSTGVWYHNEIASLIQANGFIPWPLQKHENQGNIDTPATAVLSAAGSAAAPYTGNDPITGNGSTANLHISDPAGYCKVFTTDT